ncbi:hypothetical protein ONE63_000735 [Megalurothrips usitatus]|uniref:THO complex subunit 7 homolog n=1 Tax=Megalurothrips usitatus TaxID=439358 RepID=A0AAV7XZD6_9NEOP|nr:hypothetical protein ONE63_000735 [Megalurothrips usitatus]
MNDEDVIRRRLLIDGDGTGDDRRLNALLKMFVKWAGSEEPEPEWRTVQDRMLATLAQCDTAQAKARLASATSAEELKNYEDCSQKIQHDILSAQKNIEKTKEELKKARTIRKNRIEYDLLAKVISDQPDRQKTCSELEQLKQDLSALQTTREDLEKKLDLRRKQFRVMLGSINQLEALLDESDAEIMDVSLDDVETESSSTS